MNSRPHAFRALALALLITFVAFTPTRAKGSFEKLLVYGEGEAIELTDPSLLAFDFFNDFSAPYPGTPSLTSPGFLVVRGAVDSRASEYVAFDSLRFFPETTSSQAFVYYEGLINGWSEFDHKWYPARPQAGEAILAALRSSNAQSAGPSPLSIAATAAVAAIAVGFFAGRSANRRPQPSSTPES